jgi:hypothetical protein
MEKFDGKPVPLTDVELAKFNKQLSLKKNQSANTQNPANNDSQRNGFI